MSSATYFITWRVLFSQSPLPPAARTIVVEALNHFDEERYQLHAYVVMDDHIHVLLTPLNDWKIEKLVQSWKSFTANQIQRKCGRQGSIWLREYFDRIVRNEQEFIEKANYIMGNPIKRWPESEMYEWVGLGKSYR